MKEWVGFSKKPSLLSHISGILSALCLLFLIIFTPSDLWRNVLLIFFVVIFSLGTINYVFSYVNGIKVSPSRITMLCGWKIRSFRSEGIKNVSVVFTKANVSGGVTYYEVKATICTQNNEKHTFKWLNEYHWGIDRFMINDINVNSIAERLNKCGKITAKVDNKSE